MESASGNLAEKEAEGVMLLLTSVKERQVDFNPGVDVMESVF